MPDVPPARPPGAICSGGGWDALGGATGGGAACGGAGWRSLRNGNAGRRHAGQNAKTAIFWSVVISPERHSLPDVPDGMDQVPRPK